MAPHFYKFKDRKEDIMKRIEKKLLSVLVAGAMIINVGVPSQSVAAAGKLKLSAKSVTVQVGKSKKVTVKNAPKKAKVVWSSKNTKIAKVNQKGKITAVKAGNTKVIAKVSYVVSKKKTTKKLQVAVKVKKNVPNTATTEPTGVPTTAASGGAVTTAPGSSNQPTATDAPVITSNAPLGGASDTPATAEPEKSTGPAKLVIPECDFSDPSEGVEDVETVDNSEINGDVSNYVEKSRRTESNVVTHDSGMMRKNLNNTDLIKFMGQGWNLANTLESCGIVGGKSPNDFEQGWGNIVTNQGIISGLKEGGFNSVRVPVAWSNMVSDDGEYTINSAYLKRVEEVINYCLNKEMYVIINIHYDGDWWGQFGDPDQSVRDEAWKRFESYWQQIAERYKGYSDRLIFESANEELGDRLNDDWVNAKTGAGNYTGILTEDECYKVVNAINQKFVEIVRKTGGNNLYRQLLIAGYNTDIDMTTNKRFLMPVDTVKTNGTSKLNVSVHYYTPSAYCISEDKTNEIWYTDSWGTDDDINQMRTYFEKMTRFTKEGYSVIIGEYGPQLMSKKGVPEFIKQVMIFGEEYGYCPMIWNTAMYNRSDCLFEYEDIAEVYEEITGVKMPLEEGPDRTGTIGVSLVNEEEVEFVASWEGKWTRTNNTGVQTTVDADGNTVYETNPDGSYIPVDGEVGQFSTTSCSDGIEMVSNAFWWQLFVNYDWSSLNEPCIRITMANDAISQGAAFQLGYTTIADGGSYTLVDYDNSEYGSKVFTLKMNKLAVKPWVVLSSSSPGATITKIEIFDKK